MKKLNLTEKEVDTLDMLAMSYYDILEKQRQSFPTQSIFVRPKQEDIQKYFEPLIFNIEKTIGIIVDTEIKLRYNNLFVLPNKAEFLKNFREELGYE